MTYRNHGEDGVDHSCSNGRVDRLGDTCSLKDPSRVVKHLTKKTQLRDQRLVELIELPEIGRGAQAPFRLNLLNAPSVGSCEVLGDLDF